MRVRAWAKYRIYGRTGTFPYWGVRVHFPKRSSAFRLACEQGTFEAQNVHVLQCLCPPGGLLFDIGSNLGLMAVPILSSVPNSTVVSFEPSPNTLPWLRATVAGSQYGERWQLVEKAVGSKPGNADFSVSIPTEGLYDGLVHTHRAAESRLAKVEVTTVDLEWRRLGCPAIAAIKIDVEGGELDVLRGARQCLAEVHPFVLLEWCTLNLKAYEIPPDALFYFACEHGYNLYSLPAMVPVLKPSDLVLHAMVTESFLMAPSA